MANNNFHIVNKNGNDVIRSGDSDLKITLYNLITEDYHFDESCIHLFGDDHGDELTFEITNEDSDLDEIKAVIKWYTSEKLDYPAMEILNDNPRPGQSKDVINDDSDCWKIRNDNTDPDT